MPQVRSTHVASHTVGRWGREQNRFRDRGVDTVRVKVTARSSRSIALSGGNHKSLGAKLEQEQAGLHAALKLSVLWIACGRLVKHLHTWFILPGDAVQPTLPKKQRGKQAKLAQKLFTICKQLQFFCSLLLSAFSPTAGHVGGGKPLASWPIVSLNLTTTTMTLESDWNSPFGFRAFVRRWRRRTCSESLNNKQEDDSFWRDMQLHELNARWP